MIDLPDSLQLERRGAVAVVTMNRPDQLNALDVPIRHAMRDLFQVLDTDPEVRAVVLTGAGRAFSAGGDLDDILALHGDPVFRRQEMRDAQEWVDLLVSLRTPVIAAVNGPSVGLGCTTALLCDIVLIAESAYFADPHVNVGLVAGDGGALLWPLLVGPQRAKRYLLTGDRIGAVDAERFGLASEVVPDGEVVERSIALAQRIAALPARAIQDTKVAVNLLLRDASAVVMPFSTMAEEHSASLDDLVEAVNAARKPR